MQHFTTIAIVTTALVAVISGLPKEDADVKAALVPYSFDDIFDSSLRPRGFSPNWISGSNSFYYRARNTGSVQIYNASADQYTVLIDNTTFTTLSTGTYFVSSDLSHVLFATNITSQWRHSFSAQYHILDVNTSALTPFPNGLLAGEILDYAGWAPSSLALSFVYKNNLYYQDSPTGTYRQITTDGDPTDIFNGVPDWLYEEDVISDRVSHYWSPDSKHILYARINDTQVPMQSWPWYGPKTDVTGETREVRYPKAGDVRNGAAGPNSEVELFVVDVSDTSSDPKSVPPPNELVSKDHYYLQVAWAGNELAYVTWANRVQNQSYSLLYDVTQASPLPSTQGLVYSVDDGWVEVPPPTPWFINTTHYLTIHPKEEGTTGTWRHLALVTLAGGNITFLTSGQEEIDNIYGYSESKNLVYYSSTKGDPTERHINVVGGPDASNKTSTCLTCSSPVECRYITSSFSDTTDYYFLNCRGPEIPTYTLRSLVQGELSKNVVFEDNADVAARLSTRDLPSRSFTEIPIGGGYSGRAEIFLPPNHATGKQYPLLIFAYAGPGSQRVVKTYPIGGSTNNWLTYLKSTHGVVVASVDSRGAIGRGDKFKFEMYRNLGTVEIQDQIAVARQIRTFPYINPALRSAIFGWSYGGFAAAHVIGDTSKTVECGISVAPVTTKAYYDTAYTERVLGLATPDDDEVGYNNTDVMNKVENFKDKKFMIAHGIADDNVHFMHATQLISALANADVMFRQNVYVDQNHGISSPGQSRHLYHTMTEFLLNDCWPVTNVDQPVSDATSVTAPIYSMSILLIANLITHLLWN